MQTINVKTSNAQQFIDITHDISQIVQDSGVTDGEVVVYVPHTTAGVTINESADPDVVKDIISTLEKIIPIRGNYRHMEGNSHAHIKSSLMGCSQRVIISGGRMVLGTWQGIFFCEFDGPRSRKVYVKVVGE
ncbi:secondary thiamine-phosphate synthase enzyme YjbQ [bacterium]|nr:secondary thiamine-phosphate synthase enzyme YjbQ [bacterium]MBU1024822.1 secondary thiamine-phosphate synthase enzyme YjbQ [bacterium]